MTDSDQPSEQLSASSSVLERGKTKVRDFFVIYQNVYKDHMYQYEVRLSAEGQEGYIQHYVATGQRFDSPGAPHADSGRVEIYHEPHTPFGKLSVKCDGKIYPVNYQ